MNRLFLLGVVAAMGCADDVDRSTEGMCEFLREQTGSSCESNPDDCVLVRCVTDPAGVTDADCSVDIGAHSALATLQAWADAQTLCTSANRYNVVTFECDQPDRAWDIAFSCEQESRL